MKGKVSLTLEDVKSLVERSVSHDASIRLLMEFAEEAVKEVERLRKACTAVREQAEDWMQPQHTSDRQQAGSRILIILNTKGV